MKEFSLLLTQFMQRGLPPDADVQRNAPFWETVTNIQPSPLGMVKMAAITNPVVSPSTTVSWPWPQLIRGEEITLLAFEQALYSMNESTWAGTDLSSAPGFFESGDPTTTETIDASGGMWQSVFFRDQWYLTNGQQLVYQTPRESDSKILVTTTAELNALAIGKDSKMERMIFGGLSGTNLSASDWTNIFAVWRRSQEVLGSWQEQDTAIGTNWIVYGPPGGGSWDLPESLIQGALGLLTAAQFAEVTGPIYELVEQGVIGMCPLSTRGAVQAIKEHANGIVVYTTDAVHDLRRDGVNYIPNQILEQGIAGRGAVAGTESEHVFVSNQNVLFRIRDSIERIGYENKLDTLTAADIVITRDADQDDYYSSDGFVFSGDQLHETTRITTGLSRVSTSGLIGVSSDLGTDTNLELKTLPFNFSRPGMKTIKQIDFETINVDALECRLHYNYDEDSTDYGATPWVPANNEGVANPFATALNFKLEVRGAIARTNPKLDNIRVHFQTPDRRYVRGGIGVEAEREEG
jgi:hypothetical protein